MSFTFDSGSFIEAASAGRIRWQVHALKRRLDRGVSAESVVQTLIDFDVVEFYPDSYPLPSALLMGADGSTVIHVTAAFNSETQTVQIITVYFPDEKRFQSDFRTRRRNN